MKSGVEVHANASTGNCSFAPDTIKSDDGAAVPAASPRRRRRPALARSRRHGIENYLLDLVRARDSIASRRVEK